MYSRCIFFVFGCIRVVFSNGNLPETPCLSHTAIYRRPLVYPLSSQTAIYRRPLVFSYGNLPPVLSNCNLPETPCLSHTAIYPLSSQTAIYRMLIVFLIRQSTPCLLKRQSTEGSFSRFCRLGSLERAAPLLHRAGFAAIRRHAADNKRLSPCTSPD